MPKYELIDDNNNPVGFVVIRSETITTMQSVAGGGNAGVLSAVGPMAEAALFVVILGGSVAAIRVAGGDGLLAGAVGVAGSLVVVGLRAWRGGQPILGGKNDSPTKIQVEQISGDGRHWVLRDFNEAITLEDLQAVASAVGNWGEWSRKVTTRQAHLSQGKHNKLQDDLIKLWYIEPLPNGSNGYKITRQGRRFFEAVTSIPQK